jgi:putative CocE/NonD family hydrolase
MSEWFGGIVAASLAAVALCFTSPGARAEPFDVGAHYEKSEHRVRMRDGVELHTVVYRPRDRTQRHPILLHRTPYSAGPYGEGLYREALWMAPTEEFLRAGYIFVFQDGRGTLRSGGEWVDFRPALKDRKAPGAIDEGTDTYDTIDWLVKNLQGHNGRVGQWGISYPGWYTVQALLEPHPALKAASPQATTGDPFIGDDYHHNGAFIVGNLGFLEGMTRTSGPGRELIQTGAVPAVPSRIGLDRRWGYDFYLNVGPISEINAKYFGGRLLESWDAFIEHPDYDEYWQSRNFIRPLGEVSIPVLHVAGWFDEPDPYGQIATYQRIEERNPRNANILVVGPWQHGDWHYNSQSGGQKLGDIDFGSRTADLYRRDIIFPFFEAHLRGKGKAPTDEATVFETGGNAWHRLEQWPPRGVRKRSIYFARAGGLGFDAPRGQGGDTASDTYVSSPAKPVPDVADPDHEFTIADQRHASTRPDVLTYRTEPLTEDITIAGPTDIELFVSTSGTDSDWFVKLIDAHPDVAPEGMAREMAGYQMLLAFEVMRGKYRNSFSTPEPMKPGEVTPIRFQLRDRFHTFRKGHRIMIQVHSSWFPMFDRNPQAFMNIYRAKPEDFRDATQTVHRSPAAPSHLALPVLER